MGGFRSPGGGPEGRGLGGFRSRGGGVPDVTGGLLRRGLIAEQPDEGLFFVDTGNAEKGEWGGGCFFWGGTHDTHPPRVCPPLFLACPPPLQIGA